MDVVHQLSDLGAYGVSFHDNDLVPAGAGGIRSTGHRQAVPESPRCPPACTFRCDDESVLGPIFKEGAFTANDTRIRRFAVMKACEAAELGAEFGASVFVLWGAGKAWKQRRQRTSAWHWTATRRPSTSYASTSETVDWGFGSLSNRSRTNLAGNILLPTVGHALAFIGALEHSDMVGLNPEFAHETMSGLSFSQAVAQTLWHDKLFHIDLNAQRIGKFDQDFRFGSEGIRDAFYVVKLLEDAQWDGMRHFDAHPYRTEDSEGVWDFARGCMRTYLILAEKNAPLP